MSKYLERFRRVSSQRYMPEVDGMRFLAIIPVVLLHFRTAFLRYNGNYTLETLSSFDRLIDKWIKTGDVGVHIFFAISGFILTLPFANHYINGSKKVSLKRYFLKRLTRLEPPYIITLTLLFLIHMYLQTDPVQQLVRSYFASLVYSHNWIFGKWSIINPVAWSLEIEVQFYIMVPVLTLLFAIRNKLLKRILLFALVFFFPFVNDNIFHTGILSLLRFGQYFVIGILVADIYLSFKSIGIKKYIIDIVGSITIILIFVFQFYRLHSLVPWAIFVVFISVLYGGMLKKIFSNQLISIIGGMCYITYLIHYSLITGLVKYLPHFSTGLGYWYDFVINGIYIIPLVLIISAYAFIYLEKPFMRHDWPQRFKQFVLSGLFKKKRADG
jgi:peptidoglycan/LPS O-acetylase OafA/YrhL